MNLKINKRFFTSLVGTGLGLTLAYKVGETAAKTTSNPVATGIGFALIYGFTGLIIGYGVGFVTDTIKRTRKKRGDHNE